MTSSEEKTLKMKGDLIDLSDDEDMQEEEETQIRSKSVTHEDIQKALSANK